MMILSELSRLFLANNKETGHRIMLISRNCYRLWANDLIPVQPFDKQEKSSRNLTLSRNALFRKIEYRCMQNQSHKKYFQLVEEKDVKTLSFQWMFGLLKLKIIDNSFSYKEFINNSEEALCIVSDKIAGEEFSDLDELLTTKCLNEVKNNITKLRPEQKRLFPLEKGNKTLSMLSKIYVDSDSSPGGSQFEEKTVTILLISAFIAPTEINAGQNGNHLFKQYHTEFKRSYKNNIKGHWMISDMNMKLICVSILCYLRGVAKLKMAEQQAGTSFQCESDESVVELELYRPDTVEEEDSISSDEHALMITNEIMQYVLSKDRKIYWMLNPMTTDEEEPLPPSKTFVPTPNIYSISSITDIRSTFRLYLNHSIVDTIIMNTNKHGRKIYGNNWTELTHDLMEAFIGLLLLGGVFQSHGEPMKELWNIGTGRQIFRLAMTLKVFLQISRALNFESNNPAEGDKNDKLAPIRGIWDQWVQLLSKFFNPGNNVTIGEQIIGFRGLCPIKQFSSSKSSQYGIKVCTLCDSKTSYVLKVHICEGKLSEEKLKKDESMQTALCLTQGLKYRNVTCNNVFTSYQLGQLLLRRKLTMLGLITSYRPELPAMEPNKELYSSDFYFTEDTTLLHYVPKKNQPVFLLSTKHKKRQISDQEDKKPLMYTEYENTKGVIEMLERGNTPYSCKRKTKYWTTTLFYHMIDISAHNAFILWTGVYPTWKGKKLQKRRMFLEELGKALILPYMSTRENFPQTEEAMALLKHLQEKCGYNTTSAASKAPKKKPKCKHCQKKCDTNTDVKCASCKKFLCKTHTIYVCSDCKK